MKISYQITREDFIEAQKLHRSKSPRAFVRAIVLQHQFTADISEDGVNLESPDFDANLKWGSTCASWSRTGFSSYTRQIECSICFPKPLLPRAKLMSFAS